MKFALLKIFLLFALLAPVPAFATTITFVGDGTTTGCVSGGVVGAGSCNAGPTSGTAGNQVVIFTRGGTSALSSYVQDSNMSTLSQGQAAPYQSANSLQSFVGLQSTGVTTYTDYGLAAANSLEWGEYSGGVGVNLNPTITCPNGTITNNICSGTGTTLTVGVTLQYANDVARCAFSQKPPNASATFSAPLGNNSHTTTSPTMAVSDNTGSAGATVMNGWTLSSSTAWNAVCVELQTVPTSAAYYIAQISPSGYGSLTGPAACPATGGVVTCTWAIKTTTAGSSYVGHISDHSDFGDAQRTIPAVAVCSALTGGICDGTHHVIDAPTVPGAACRSYVLDNQSPQQESDSNDNFYMIGGAGGGNFVTVTLSGADAVNTERKIGTLVEFVPSFGTFAFDGCGTSTFAALGSSFAGTAIAGLTGSNDAVVQGWTGGVYAQSIASPYASPTGQGMSIPNHMAVWVAINQVPVAGSLAAAAITASSGTNGGAGTALALKLSAPPPGAVFGTKAVTSGNFITN